MKNLAKIIKTKFNNWKKVLKIKTRVKKKNKKPKKIKNKKITKYMS